MEWMKAIGDAIQYMEDHITEDISVDDIADYVNISSFYFQKGFAVLCGFTVAEYIRNRRLALAGNEIAATEEKVIDIAMKYGYDSGKEEINQYEQSFPSSGVFRWRGAFVLP